MKYGSLCSGIEAATVAWHPLGWTPEFFAEIEAFPSAVLAHHYPEVPNLGDITKFKTWKPGAIDVLVGGTPCQSFSVAGLRKGMAGPRGNLALVFLAIADALRPRWILWENVPGVLSSGEGWDFGCFLGGLAELGYGFAFRVLDAQHGGVPQRRRRVFVVGHLGDWRRAAAVLFERESLSWNPPPSRAAGQRAAACLTRGADSSGKGGYAGRRREDDENIIQSIAGTLNPGAHPGAYNGQDAYNDLLIPETAHALRSQSQLSHREDQDNLVCHSLRADGHDASEDGTGRGVPLVAETLRGHPRPGSNSLGNIAFDSTQVTSKANRSNPKPGDPCHPLASKAHPPSVVAPTLDQRSGRSGQNSFATSGGLHPATTMSVRRLTPRECERLMGFPTRIDRVIIRPCFDPEKTRFVSAEVRYLKSLTNAFPAEDVGSVESASSADVTFWNDPASRAALVVLHVRTQFDARVERISSLGKCVWSVDGAAQRDSFPLPTEAVSFARDIARLVPDLAHSIIAGKEVSLPNISGSTPLGNGSSPVVMFGRENAVDANAVAGRPREGTKSTTRKRGRNTPACACNATTLLFSVLDAMTSFIREKIGSADSCSVVLDLESDYTAIPVGKNRKPAADGPRYKAIGNSMVVPEIRWLGRRIQLVEDMK